ncbi:MAG TPA: NAD-dependent succinate-semialdehyde dehydrogenase [Casimicrobiaceae bacterium]|nr:NAD-dependent succinate-semialdehyde dehydrogenase [Casimicrobiaceae bacterium]
MAPDTRERRAALPLKDPSLFKEQCCLDGRWIDADGGARHEVANPATGRTIGSVPRMGAGETRRAIEAADKAWPAWRSKTAKERSAVLRKWAELQLANVDDLALIMTTEQGKPLAEARAEVTIGAAYTEWFAEEAKRVYGDVIPTIGNDRRLLAIKQPVGVCAAITPWNFPSSMITRKVSPALAAGCTVVIKPAEATPYSALALAVLAERAGFPPGVLNVVVGSAKAIGGEMTANPLVRKLSFTGSTEVGRLLMQQVAPTIKKLSLELGGNAPFIVFDDADLEEAVAGAIVCKFRNSGQTCISANRMLVQDGIYDDFLAAFIEAVSKLVVADGFTPGVNVGPLIDEPAVGKVERHVGNAVDGGAELLLGGSRIEGQFFQPSVLVGVSPEMAMSCEETFGPVAGIARFATEAEAIAVANDTPYGLSAYFFSRDVGRITRVGEALEYGIVGVNTGLISTEVAPFGGVKESGIGREGSSFGIDEWVELKYWAIGGVQ